jgi:hypothetical protein
MEGIPEAVPPQAEEAASAGAPESALLSYQPSALPPIPVEWTHARVFGLREEELESQIRRGITLKLMADAGVYALLTVLWTFSGVRGFALLVLCTVALVVFGSWSAYQCWRIVRRLRGQWPTFRIIIADQGLLRSCRDFPDLQLAAGEIVRCEKSKRGILVRSGRRLRRIHIPRQLERFEEALQAVEGLHRIEPARRRGVRQALALLMLLAMMAGYTGAMLTGLYANGVWTELVCIAALLAFSGYVIVIAWRNPNAMRQQRIAAYMTLVFPTLLGMKVVFVHAFRFLLP